MLIIIDKKIPDQTKASLRKYGDLLEMETNGIVYDAISGHPDVFFCQAGDVLLADPKRGYAEIKKYDKWEKGRIISGHQPLGDRYPETARYNAVVTENCLIHNLEITDRSILMFCSQKEHIHVEQGYTRCNLLALKNDHFITSDKGIEKTLTQKNKKVLFVDPKGIELPGYPHGFFGGACGIWNNKVFVIGELGFMDHSYKIREFINHLNYEIIELYKGPPFDGGGILFV